MPPLFRLYFDTTKMQLEAKRFGQTGARKRRESPGWASGISFTILIFLSAQSCRKSLRVPG